MLCLEAIVAILRSHLRILRRHRCRVFQLIIGRYRIRICCSIVTLLVLLTPSLLFSLLLLAVGLGCIFSGIIVHLTNFPRLLLSSCLVIVLLLASILLSLTPWATATPTPTTATTTTSSATSTALITILISVISVIFVSTVVSVAALARAWGVLRVCSGKIIGFVAVIYNLLILILLIVVCFSIVIVLVLVTPAALLSSFLIVVLVVILTLLRALRSRGLIILSILHFLIISIAFLLFVLILPLLRSDMLLKSDLGKIWHRNTTAIFAIHVG